MLEMLYVLDGKVISSGSVTDSMYAYTLDHYCIWDKIASLCLYLHYFSL